MDGGGSVMVTFCVICMVVVVVLIHVMHANVATCNTW